MLLLIECMHSIFGSRSIRRKPDSSTSRFVDVDESTPHLSRFVDNPIRRCRRIDTAFVPIRRHINSSMSTNRHKYYDEILLQINARFVDILLQKKPDSSKFQKNKNTATTYFPALFRELSQLCIITYTANNVRHSIPILVQIASARDSKLHHFFLLRRTFIPRLSEPKAL